MTYNLHVGIDYSGAETATSRLPALRVFAAGDAEPTPVTTPNAPAGERRNWSRKEIADWLVTQARSGTRFVAGIDHGFSFPITYFERYRLAAWPTFLDDFCEQWPTHRPHTYVDFIRDFNPTRVGTPDEYRLTERRAGSSRSVFRFDGHRATGKATHAGIPWLRSIRQEAGDLVHVWPFDGWDVPPDKSVLVEVDPVILRTQPTRRARAAARPDAYNTARWLAEAGRAGTLERYLAPPLTDDEKAVTRVEGWILGVT
ncbi:MAG: hypothetical protein JWO38_1123 [Gemmataceae bacterium]|nr:hypothetical protein [Gemmataceae bacterium]